MRLRLAHIFIVAAACGATSVCCTDARAQGKTSPVVPFVFNGVIVEHGEVFDTSGALDILNSFHWLTKPGVVEDEIFFERGDTVTQNDLDELDRNLRDLSTFSSIEFTTVLEDNDADRRIPRATLRIRTQDSWSLRSYGSISAAGDDISAAVSLREVNLFGYASQVGGSVEYSTIDDRGFRLAGFAYEPNLAGSHIYVGVDGATSRFEKSGGLFFGRPFFSDRERSAFAAGAKHYSGREVFFLPEAESVSRYVAETRTSDGSAWYSLSRGERGSRFYGSSSLLVDRTTRDSSLPFAPRAFENSVGAFVGLQSIKRSYERLDNADLSGDRLIPVGGSGAVSIGKISPHSGGLDNVMYLGAEARNAVRHGPLHLYAMVAGATGLAGKTARFTLQRFTGASHLALPYGALAARLEQVTVWNWPRYTALALDNTSGLRGYELSGLVGHNRVVANFEYRAHPIVDVWLFSLGAAAFYDVGTVWQQGTTLTAARFHSSIGAGLRIGSAGGSFNRGLLRVDIAYNFDERRVSRFIISSQEAFDAFGSLEYRPPGPYIP